MLDEESLDPRAPSYVAAVVGDARRRLRAGVPRRHDRRLPRHRGGDGRRAGRGDRPRRAARAGVRARRRRPGAGRAGARRASGACRARTVAAGDDAAELARALGRRVAGGLAERDAARPPPRRRGAALRARDAARRSSCRSRASTSTRAPTRSIIDEQARAHLELTESLLDRRRAGLADRGARREPAPRWAGGCCAAGCCFRRSTSRPSAAGTTPSSGWSARTRRATTRAACSARSPTSSAWSGGRASASRRRAIWRCWAARSRACPSCARRWRTRDAGEIGGSLAADESLLSLGDDLAAEIAAELDARAARRRARRRPRTAASSTPASRRARRAARHRRRAGASRIAAIEARERERTGIPSLKVKFNSVFGYYIEVTRAHLRVGAGRLPPQADRRQRRALRDAGAGRVRADDPVRRRAAHRARAGDLHGAARDGRGRGRRGCSRSPARVAAVDTLAGARRGRAPRAATAGPDVDDSGVIDLADARHPVVERLAAAGRVRPQRRPPRSGGRAGADRHRPQHGGQVDADPAGGAGRHPGADGRLRAGARARASASAIACSRASAPATTWRAASRRSWSRCARPRRSCATRPRAA